MEENPLGVLIVLAAIVAFVVYVVIPVVGAVLAIAALLMAAIASAGALSGIVIGVKNFHETIIEAHQKSWEKSSNIRVKKILNRLFDEQPAYLMYMYDAGWYVINYALSNVWLLTHTNAKDWFDKGEEWGREAESSEHVMKVWGYGLALGGYLGGLFHYVAAFLIVSFFIILQVVFLVLALIATSLAMTFIGSGTWLYGRFYGIYHRCPSCHHEMPIPVYICPECSSRHTRLWASPYGILRHRCEGTLPSGDTCGELLPTLKSLGQNKLIQRCPNCDYVLEGLGGTNIHIPIVGGPAVGKSHYIVMATMELIDKHASANGLTITLPDTRHQRDFEFNGKLLKSGKRLPKTSNADDSAKAYLVEIAEPSRPVPKLLYIYDAAGEYFTANDSAQQQLYFKYVHGILLIVDPFSIEKVRKAYEPELIGSPGIIAPSADTLESVYDNLLDLFETKFKMKRNKKFSAPIAIVVTKCDAFDLEDKIGEPAALKYKMSHPKVGQTGDAINNLVEEFLIDYGAGNFVRNLKAHSSRVRFFSCSAIGLGNNTTSASSFEGVRVLDPLLWLMSKV